MRPILFAAMLGCPMIGGAVADEQYTSCVDSTTSNADWAECGAAFVQREDAKLNESWSKLQSLTDPESLARLKAEQDAWVKFRELACRLYTDEQAFGREGQVLSFPACIAATVAARTEQMRDYLREVDP